LNASSLLFFFFFRSQPVEMKQRDKVAMHISHWHRLCHGARPQRPRQTTTTAQKKHELPEDGGLFGEASAAPPFQPTVNQYFVHNIISLSNLSSLSSLSMPRKSSGRFLHDPVFVLGPQVLSSPRCGIHTIVLPSPPSRWEAHRHPPTTPCGHAW
jgi:hypothetical protein